MNSVAKNHINNKLIAKNTMLLYLRMFLTMGVALYTSRVVLRVLGIEDFGVFTVVGGAVTLLSFLNGAMAAGTQRYLSFAIGRNDQAELKRLFSATLTIHIAIAIIIVIFAESFGLWFINNELVIPANRLEAANWVYQFSILSIVISVIQVPYNAMLIAYERMDAFAFIGILDVTLKLAIVFVLQYLDLDKLALYGALLFGTTLVIGLVYKLYCSRYFTASKFKFEWEPKRFKELVSYAGWNLWGNLASVGLIQGLVLLVNLFFGPTVNGAQAIAIKINATITQFVVGFQMAMNPQLVKSYAVGQTDEMLKLMKRGSKLSFLLIYLLVVPVLFHTHYILDLWLDEVPEYTVIFSQLMLVVSMIDSFSGPLMTAVQATGKIKLYQSVVGGVLLLNVPISYIFIKLGYPPQVTLFVMIVISVVAFISRLFILQRVLPFSALSFLRGVVIRPLAIGAVTAAAYFAVTIESDSFFEFTKSIVVVELLAILLVVVVGVNRDERKFVVTKIRTIIKNKLS